MRPVLNYVKLAFKLSQYPLITAVSVAGVDSKLIMRKNILLCAGYKNPEKRIPKKKFFEFNDREKRFTEIDPFPFDIDLDVWESILFESSCHY